MNLLDLARTALADREDADTLPRIDAAIGRRRNRALALLDAEPNRQVAVVAQAGDPAHVTVAIRDGSVGDMEIAAERYDGFALLALMNQYANA